MNRAALCFESGNCGWQGVDRIGIVGGGIALVEAAACPGSGLRGVVRCCGMQSHQRKPITA
eukprot:6677015-Prymnesium_polylepis.1